METITSANPTHHHHWIIETANGPRSEGVCKYCHAHRDFPNWLAGLDFSGNGSGGNEGNNERPRAVHTW